MNRLLLGIAVLGAAAVIGGCPIYSGQNEYRVCMNSGASNSGCYSCPNPTYSGACIAWQCNTNSDCDLGYACTADNQCVPSPVSDGGGPVYGCGSGCPSGTICELAGGLASCVAIGDSGIKLDAQAPTPDASDGAAPEASPPDASPSTISCNADADCHGGGAKCVDGACTPQLNLCSDGTQCIAAGSACVDGLCEATCSASSPCPSGYGCDFNRGVCNLDPGACVGSGTASCQGGATCVEGHCVAPCAPAEVDGGAPTCPGGLICVNGGCIPDQAARFACANDGDEGLVANACLGGYTCLHHSCYGACSLEGGAACGVSSGPAQACKNVTIETGTYAVCASAGTLGSECDPAQGKYCSAGAACVNGSCM